MQFTDWNVFFGLPTAACWYIIYRNWRGKKTFFMSIWKSGNALKTNQKRRRRRRKKTAKMPKTCCLVCISKCTVCWKRRLVGLFWNAFHRVVLLFRHIKKMNIWHDTYIMIFEAPQMAIKRNERKNLMHFCNPQKSLIIIIIFRTTNPMAY